MCALLQISPTFLIAVCQSAWPWSSENSGQLKKTLFPCNLPLWNDSCFVHCHPLHTAKWINMKLLCISVWCTCQNVTCIIWNYQQTFICHFFVCLFVYGFVCVCGFGLLILYMLDFFINRSSAMYFVLSSFSSLHYISM